jgi:hypothetical protein
MDRQLYGLAGTGLMVAFYYGYTKRPVLVGYDNAIRGLDTAAGNRFATDTAVLFLGTSVMSNQILKYHDCVHIVLCKAPLG